MPAKAGGGQVSRQDAGPPKTAALVVQAQTHRISLRSPHLALNFHSFCTVFPSDCIDRAVPVHTIEHSGELLRDPDRGPVLGA